MLVKLIGVFFTYFASSIIIFLLLTRLTKATQKEIPKLFFLTIGLGPITISWFLTRFLSIFPKHSDFFYIILVGISFALPCLLCYKQFRWLGYLYCQAKKTVKEFDFIKRWPESLLLFIVLVALGVLFFQCIGLPIRANDPLQYAMVSSLIYDHGVTDIYPFINPDAQTGFYAVSSHPLGYISLMIWSYVLQGSSQHAGLIKIISPFYVFYSLLLLWYIFSRRGNIYGILGMFLLITTPFYYTQSSVCHIDPLRVYTFFLAFVCLYELIQNNNNLWFLIFSGFVVGMSMYSHSIGILTLPFFVLIYFIVSRKRYSKKALSLIVVIIVALLVGGSRYFHNYKDLGYLINDNCEVWAMEELHFGEYTRQVRHLATPSDRMLFGILKGFSNFKLFGFSYWLFLLGIIFCLKEFMTNMQAQIFLGVILLFYGGVVLSSFLGMDIFIRNSRYFLTVHPFVVYVGSLFLGNVYEKMGDS